MSDPLLIKTILKWKPDFILVVGWYHMVPKSIREIALTAGLHGSLLPDYSGGAPLVWAIINGESEAGITFFQFSDGVDNGHIIGQAKEMISFSDTIFTLYSRIEDKGLQLLKNHLPEIARGEAVFVEQDESKRTIFPQRGPEDGEIEWNQPAKNIYNFIRAQTKPYPGAFTTYNLHFAPKTMCFLN
jgi:methionyl-tRNA formyltransferase